MPVHSTRSKTARHAAKPRNAAPVARTTTASRAAARALAKAQASEEEAARRAVLAANRAAQEAKAKRFAQEAEAENDAQEADAKKVAQEAEAAAARRAVYLARRAETAEKSKKAAQEAKAKIAAQEEEAKSSRSVYMKAFKARQAARIFGSKAQDVTSASAASPSIEKTEAQIAHEVAVATVNHATDKAILDALDKEKEQAFRTLGPAIADAHAIEFESDSSVTEAFNSKPVRPLARQATSSSENGVPDEVRASVAAMKTPVRNDPKNTEILGQPSYEFVDSGSDGDEDPDDLEPTGNDPKTEWAKRALEKPRVPLYKGTISTGIRRKRNPPDWFAYDPSNESVACNKEYWDGESSMSESPAKRRRRAKKKSFVTKSYEVVDLTVDSDAPKDKPVWMTDDDTTDVTPVKTTVESSDATTDSYVTSDTDFDTAPVTAPVAPKKKKIVMDDTEDDDDDKGEKVEFNEGLPDIAKPPASSSKDCKDCNKPWYDCTCYE